jgi:hypothetical protein
MEELQLLATTLGLSALCGINLYLTVFVTGLALQQGWLTLSPQLQSLEVLNHPAIIVIAGILYFIEFLADKIPWIDSLWDVVHTAIRPIGAAVLSLSLLGEMHATAEIVAVLLCGGIALGTHTVKAGTRLIVNASPEPFSNMGLSLAEDAFVLGGVFTVVKFPLATLALLLVLVAIAIVAAPWGFRRLRAFLDFAAGKLNAPAEAGIASPLPVHLPMAVRHRIHEKAGGEEKLLWAISAYTGDMRGWPAYQRVWLAATDNPERLVLAAKGAKGKIEVLSPAPLEVSQAGRFFYDEFHIFFREEHRSWELRLPKNRSGWLRAIIRVLDKEKTPAGAVPS